MTQSQLIVGMAIGGFFAVPVTVYIATIIGDWFAQRRNDVTHVAYKTEYTSGWVTIWLLVAIVVFVLALK